MKTNNPIIDNIIDVQTDTMNTWMDSAKKIQAAIASGNIIAESQSIYKDMMDRQAAVLKNIQTNAANSFKGNDDTKPEEFFKNWYNQQMNSLKYMGDLNQSIYNSFANFGKNTSDYNNSFSTMNNAWTNIYDSWMNAMNSSYDTFSKNMTNSFNADMFKNMFEANQTYLKVQELFQPMIKAIQNSDFSVDTWKSIYTTENYKKMTEQLFGSLFTTNNLKDVFENSTKQLQNFFVNQNGLGKEYIAQMQNMATKFPELFSGNADQMKNLYGKMNNVFGKTFEPLLKVVTPGKEKEAAEATIALMDKVTEYSVKQSELQMHLYKTMQTAMENLAKETQDKYKDMTPGSFKVPTGSELYNEWVKINEKLFSEVFATEEFSKAKAETLSLSMDVKKHFEKQFENMFEQYPIIFKSEMEEVYKTIYDLKKTVKDLQTKLAVKGASVTTEEFEEEKFAKAKKK